ncbi:MAG: hypothetical protein ACYTEO_18720, partial [Planctomycetota bacterium]
MNRHLKMLIYSLSIILLIVGCAREVAVPVREGYLTAKEKEWLAKAYRVDRNGWTYLHIEGEPYERGFQRGFLTANEIDEFLKTTAYLLEFQTAKELDFFVEAAAKLFKKKVSREYVEEMKGMVAGMQRAGKKVTYEEMLFMNGFIDIWWYWWPKKKESMQGGCSAFIATGEATTDGKIVMGHNSWASYALL